MRVTPVGVLFHHDERAVYDAAAAQARVTHVHPLGQQVAALQALAVALALRSDSATFSRDDFLEELESVLPAFAETFRHALMQAGELFDRWEGRDLIVRKWGNRSSPTAPCPRPSLPSTPSGIPSKRQRCTRSG